MVGPDCAVLRNLIDARAHTDTQHTYALARSPRVPWDEAPAEPPKPGERTALRFRGTREKGATSCMECLGVSQEDTLEGSL